MLMNIFEGILIPFVGTTLGAACVFFMRKTLSKSVQRALAGFAAGIMVAASIWSLLIPAIKQSESMGRLSFVPAVVGFWIGILFLLALDHLIPHLHVGSDQAEGPKSKLGRTTMMVLAVTLHNIPEGMAVGVMYAGFLAENAQIDVYKRQVVTRFCNVVQLTPFIDFHSLWTVLTVSDQISPFIQAGFCLLYTSRSCRMGEKC